MTAPHSPDAPGPPAGPGSSSPVGGLADEAAQLLDALAVRLTQMRITVGAHGSVDTTAAEPAAGHQQCVGWCPVCRSADLLRGERPEVAGRLVESAIVVVGALRSLLPVVTAAGPSATAGPADESAGDHEPPPSPGIERIDIR